jgi:RNA polymerase sigma factor (sigma-70 family)
MDHETELLRRFVDFGDQRAFTELVERRIDFVFATALRKTAGDEHLARDVTQAVFLALAGRAHALVGHGHLVGWLFVTTRYLSAKFIRAHVRWRKREREANIMENPGTEREISLDDLRPFIDDALDSLSEKDRAAVMMRFFDQCSYAEIATHLKAGESAARMRVDRAVERLRRYLRGRHVVSTSTALAGALAAKSGVSAPAGLIETIVASAPVGFVSSGVATGVGIVFMTGKLKIASIGLLLALSAGSLGLYFQQRDQPTPPDLERQARLAAPNSRTLVAAKAANEISPAGLANGGATMDANAAAIKARTEKIAELRRLADLHSQGLVRPVRDFVGVEGVLDAQWAEVYGLSPTDVVRLNEVLKSARRKIETLELENASVSKDPNGAVVIHVEPFSEGAPIYDRVVSEFESVLGAERYPAFVELGLTQVEQSLRLLGVGRQTFRVIHAADTADPQKRWEVSHRILRPDGTVKYSMITDARRDGVVAHSLGALVQLLPPDL